MTDVSNIAPADRVASPAEIVLHRKPLHTEDKVAAYERRRKVLGICLGVLVPALLLLLWQVAATLHWIDSRLYPPPGTIARVGWEMVFQDGGLRSDILATLRRVLIGVAAGGLLGVVAGILLGSSRLARSALEPTLSALYVVPKLALLPVFMTIVGLGEPPLLVIVSWTVFFYVWIYTMESFVGIPAGYLEAAKSLNAGRVRTLLHVSIPAVLPQLFVALRVGVNVSIIMIVAAEFLVGTSGLGYVVFDSRRLFMNERMFVGIVAVSLMGVVLAGIVSRVGRRLTPWARPQRTR